MNPNKRKYMAILWNTLKYIEIHWHPQAGRCHSIVKTCTESIKIWTLQHFILHLLHSGTILSTRISMIHQDSAWYHEMPIPSYPIISNPTQFIHVLSLPCGSVLRGTCVLIPPAALEEGPGKICQPLTRLKQPKWLKLTPSNPFQSRSDSIWFPSCSNPM